MASYKWVFNAVAGILQSVLDAHTTEHENGGDWELNVDDLSGELADQQKPLQHTLGGAYHASATLAQLNALVSDATLDKNSDTRDPKAHASEHTDGTDDIQNAKADASTKGISTFLAAHFNDNGSGLISLVAAGGGVASGATVPAAPSDWDLFVHTPTGRKILLEYDGSKWVPIYAYGAMTVYVDGGAGTDAIDKGGAVGSGAFATIQYAINQIPPLYSGDVTVTMDDGTYNEDVVIRGKAPTGDYVIKLIGELLMGHNATASAKVTGGGATQGKLTHAGATGSPANVLIKCDTEELYRMVSSSTANDIWICGTWTDTTNKQYKYYYWMTHVDRITVEAGQKGIELYFLDLTGTAGYCLICFAHSATVAYGCSFLATVYTATAVLTVDYCYSHYAVAAHNFLIQDLSVFRIKKTYIHHDHTTGWGITLQDSYMVYYEGTIIDGSAAGGAKATAGIYVQLNSVCIGYSLWTSGYGQVWNCDIGVNAVFGGMVQYTAYMAYSGNTANETADAATFAYID